MKNKTILINTAFFFLVLLVCVFCLFAFDMKDSFVVGPLTADVSIEKLDTVDDLNQDEVIKLGFVGDIMLDRSVKKSINKNGGGDYSFPFQKILPTLKSFDWLFGNLEGPVSDKGKKVCGSIYSFQMATSVPAVLKQNNFSVVSIANNHMFDYCYSAFVDTLQNLKSADLAYIGGGLDGDEAYNPKVFNVKDLKISAVAFSEFNEKVMGAAGDRGGVAIISPERVCATVRRAREVADIVVASFHFGDEYKADPNLYQKNIAHLAVDCGADLVVGHHPHVTQPLEYYNGKPIIYSLGNFIFDQNFSEETMKGNILSVEVKNKKVDNVLLIPYKINKFFQPELVKGLE